MLPIKRYQIMSKNAEGKMVPMGQPVEHANGWYYPVAEVNALFQQLEVELIHTRKELEYFKVQNALTNNRMELLIKGSKAILEELKNAKVQAPDFNQTEYCDNPKEPA